MVVAPHFRGDDMMMPKIEETHVKKCRVVFDSSQLRELISNAALQQAGFMKSDAVEVVVKIESYKDGLGYFACMKAHVDIIEDQLKIPQAKGETDGAA